jgi:hypothetical protein
MSWTIDVELEATATNDEWWTPLTEPGRIIGLMLAILGISALTSMNKKGKTPANEKDDNISELPTQEEQDPWGRPLDEVASTDAFNVQE